MNLKHFELIDGAARRHITVANAVRVMIVGDVHGCCDELREVGLTPSLPPRTTA